MFSFSRMLLFQVSWQVIVGGNADHKCPEWIALLKIKQKMCWLWDRGRERDGEREGMREGERERGRQRNLNMEPGGNERLHASQCSSSLRTAESSVTPTKMIKCLIKIQLLDWVVCSGSSEAEWTDRMQGIVRRVKWEDRSDGNSGLSGGELHATPG